MLLPFLSFPFLLFFGLDERLSFGELKSSWINNTLKNDLGFSFSFSPSWTVFNSQHKDNDVITLVPPNNYDLFVEKMSFGMEKLKSNMSLDDYSNKAIKILSSVLKDFYLIDSSSFIISDTMWEKILFTHKTDNKIIKVLQFWSIIDGHVYIISFGTTTYSYLDYLPIIHKIISGIKISTKNTIDITMPSNIKESIYQSPEGFVLKYPSHWSKVSGQNRMSFIANQENHQDHYLERVDLSIMEVAIIYLVTQTAKTIP